MTYEDAVIEEVIKLREDHPTMGMRDMYRKLNPEQIGRDKFCALCRINNLQSRRFKNYYRTTDSSGVIRFENLTTDFVCNDINQVRVSDITYYQTLGKFYYITFIMDAYSRNIIGYSLSSDLKMVNTTEPALLMALNARKEFEWEELIFHSDGGGQYYATDFVKRLRENNIVSSMCDYAWENGQAERVNGIIKNNYLRHFDQRTLSELRVSLDKAVYLYNNEKPHSALNYLSPVEFEMSYISLKQQTKPKMTKSL